MIVVTRRVNERIVINDDISVMIIEIRGDMVRLGIEAPREVPVHRGEVFDAIRRANPVARNESQTKRDGESNSRRLVELAPEHQSLLDRLAGEAAKRLRKPISREQMLAAILSAIGEISPDWSQLERLEELPPLLLSAVAEFADGRS